MDMIAEKIKSLLPCSIQNIVYIGELPADVDSCVALVPSGGPPSHYFSTSRLDTPYLKIVCRDCNYERGNAIIQICKDILGKYSDAQTLGASLSSDIIYFGRDAKRRNMWQLTLKVFATQ